MPGTRQGLRPGPTITCYDPNHSIVQAETEQHLQALVPRGAAGPILRQPRISGCGSSGVETAVNPPASSSHPGSRCLSGLVPSPCHPPTSSALPSAACLGCWMWAIPSHHSTSGGDWRPVPSMGLITIRFPVRHGGAGCPAGGRGPARGGWGCMTSCSGGD